MGTEAKTPVASRWMHKNETKGRVFFVLERKAFGRIELMQEGRAYFGTATQKELLANWTRLPGQAEMPSGFSA
jgi:hypothetical protein